PMSKRNPCSCSTAALPPSHSLRSNSVTACPRAASTHAAASPPSPPPTTPILACAIALISDSPATQPAAACRPALHDGSILFQSPVNRAALRRSRAEEQSPLPSPVHRAFTGIDPSFRAGRPRAHDLRPRPGVHRRDNAVYVRQTPVLQQQA